MVITYYYIFTVLTVINHKNNIKNVTIFFVIFYFYTIFIYHFFVKFCTIPLKFTVKMFVQYVTTYYA